MSTFYATGCVRSLSFGSKKHNNGQPLLLSFHIDIYITVHLPLLMVSLPLTWALSVVSQRHQPSLCYSANNPT